MDSFGFQPVSTRFSPSAGSRSRFSYRRTSTSSSRNSYASNTSSASAASSINSLIFRQPSIMDLEEEHKAFGSELKILEPRPVVFFGSMEERFASL
ncbi:putative calcium channel subunit cch1 [Diaporthe ampelina]|uniref:Putative calcium channel subunit cch1 n=1 Tax=Diaporthe ampelina TaxID=1214573 RepID=A0A0G2FJ09_9PEZI|nr:putative calcium channel subunit cch1 [Diaporthe ampelina]